MSMWFSSLGDPDYRDLTTYNYGYLKAIKASMKIVNKYLFISSVEADEIKKELFNCLREQGISETKIKELFPDDN